VRTGHTYHVGDKLMELEGRWFMGRFAPRELLDGIDQYLRLETPERRKELLDTIRTRAEQLQEADKDLPVDSQSEGMLALTSTVLAAYETLLPLFDDDQRRTILFLQHVVGAVARRPFEIAFEALGKREHPLDAIEKACRKEAPLYGSYLRHRLRPPGRRHLRDASPSLLLPRPPHPPQQPAAHHRDVRLGRQLDASGGPRGQRAAGRAALPDVAGRRRLPVPGGGHRRPPGHLHRPAKPTLRR